MGLLPNLVLSLVHLLLVTVDILFLAMLATTLSYRWQPPWLMAVNSAGKPVVDWFASRVERALNYFTRKAPSRRTVLFIGMLAISLMRLLVTALFQR